MSLVKEGNNQPERHLVMRSASLKEGKDQRNIRGQQKCRA